MDKEEFTKIMESVSKAYFVDTLIDSISIKYDAHFLGTELSYLADDVCDLVARLTGFNKVYLIEWYRNNDYDRESAASLYDRLSIYYLR